MPADIEVVRTPSSSPGRYPPAVWRLLVDSADDGARNMAIDEAILDAVAEGIAPPTLRFFAWDPACLSLGRGQRLADADEARLAERGWGLVRRMTGGRAILHVDELTYSVTLLASDSRLAGGVKESYRRLSLGLLAGLEGLGASAAQQTGRVNGHVPVQGPVCFEVPSDYEIAAYGKKLLGSAQTRRRGVVLQHGTLPLSGDLGRICDVLALPGETARQEARRRVLARATTLENVLGQQVEFDQAAIAMAGGFSTALNVQLDRGELTDWEQGRAGELRAEKYAAGQWTARL